MNPPGQRVQTPLHPCAPCPPPAPSQMTRLFTNHPSISPAHPQLSSPLSALCIRLCFPLGSVSRRWPSKKSRRWKLGPLSGALSYLLPSSTLSTASSEGCRMCMLPLAPFHAGCRLLPSLPVQLLLGRGVRGGLLGLLIGRGELGAQGARVRRMTAVLGEARRWYRTPRGPLWLVCPVPGA